MSESKLDFSVRNVPDSWHSAAEEAPQEDPEATVSRQKMVRRMPTGTRPDLTTGALAGLAMTIIAGGALYLNDINARFTNGFAVIAFSVLFGVLIAIAVRIGAGPAGPEMRVGVGAALYIVGVLAVAFFAAREQFSSLNRRSPSLSQVEDLVMSLYVNDYARVAGWVIGFAAMSYTTFALRHARR